MQGCLFPLFPVVQLHVHVDQLVERRWLESWLRVREEVKRNAIGAAGRLEKRWRASCGIYTVFSFLGPKAAASCGLVFFHTVPSYLPYPVERA